MDMLRRARRARRSAYRSASQQKRSNGANVAGRGTSKELSAPRVVAVSLIEGCDERSRAANLWAHESATRMFSQLNDCIYECCQGPPCKR